MTGKVIDLTEERLKRKFVESVNNHIRGYNQPDDEFHKYHEGSLCCLYALAGLFGWNDIAILICVECNKIFKDENPKPITIQGM